jgi:hypothetical protein
MTLNGTFIAYSTGANRSAALAVMELAFLTRRSIKDIYHYVRVLRPIVFIDDITFTYLERLRTTFMNDYPRMELTPLSHVESEDEFLMKNREA